MTAPDVKQTIDMAMSVAEAPVKKLIEKYVSSGLLTLTRELSERLREPDTFDEQGRFTIKSKDGSSVWILELGLVEKEEIPDLGEIVKIDMQTATHLVNLLVHGAKSMLYSFTKYSNHPMLLTANIGLDATYTNIFISEFEEFPIRIGIIATKVKPN